MEHPLILQDGQCDPVQRILARPTVAPGLVPAGQVVTASITVTGARVGDIVQVGYGVDMSGLVVSEGFVSAPDTVKVPLYNPTGGGITPASSSWPIVLHRYKFN